MTGLFDWLDSNQRADFFVQEAPREPWHVESDEHCEYMLCGKFISVDTPQSRIRTVQPSRTVACPDCYIRLKKRQASPR